MRTALFFIFLLTIQLVVSLPVRASVEVVADPRLPHTTFIVQDGAKIALLAPYGFGPRWSWLALGGKGSKLELQQKTSSSGDAVRIEYSLASAEEMEIVQVVVGIPVAAGGAIEKITAHLTDKTTQEIAVPPARGSVPATSALEFGLRGGGSVRVDLDPPCTLANENGALRIQLAKDRVKAETTITTFTVHSSTGVKLSDTPEAIAAYTFTPGKDWAVFKPTGTLEGNVVGLSYWLDKPAGKRGRVGMDGGRFVFPDGTPVKWWGTNLQYSANAPTKGAADLTAKRFASWGVNCVRLHKFTDGQGWNGIGDPQDATIMKPDGWARFDYFTYRLQQEGVYYGWSHTFGFTVLPKNRDRLLAYDEIVNNLKGNAYALINVAEDVQDLMIERVVNLLKHENPYTHLTYAKDPALSWVELQNEDDIFFYALGGVLAKAPTYRAKYEEHFAAWLKEKYGTREALATAWGAELKDGDDLDKHVTVEINAWMLSQDSLPKKSGGARQRLLDQTAFMEWTQMKYYNRFVKAIRDAGYEGPLIGSPWQAPTMLPHFLNLRCDSRVGIVDRHNYWGGWDRINTSILESPGGGNLSSGLQQLAGRPFMLSEWNTEWPSLYSVEGPVIIAAYGLGLQGWAGSFQFNSESDSAWNTVTNKLPWRVFQVDVPNQIGQYPVLARMVLRGDVKEGPVISVRRVSDKALATGTFDFEEKVVQEGASGDLKTFTGSVPQMALAVGRNLVEFTGAEEKPSTLPNLGTQGKDNVWDSATGQLHWDAARRVITINTAGTQGMVGFGSGKDWKLDGVTIHPQSPYAGILMTAGGPKETMANARIVLLSAVARNASTDTNLLLLGSSSAETVLDEGKTPILMEPVRATIRLLRKPAKVEILDHDGCRSGRTVTMAADGSFDIDTAKDGGWLYEISY